MSNDISIDEYFGENIPEEVIHEDPIQKDEKENLVLGIDLGTTNSCVSVWRKNNLEIIPDMFGRRTIPSVVAFTEKSTYIGREAKRQIELNTENTFYEVKRLIGKKIDDTTVINDMEFLTYGVIPDDENNIIIQSNLTSRKSEFTPEEISSYILRELKHMADDYLGPDKGVTKTVITVPAYFNDAQRQATKDAATISGLDCIRIINEPTAAALAYGLEKKSAINDNQDMNVIVYDIGGGTTDVSLLNIDEGTFQVLGSCGNTHLGGADFDNRLISYCMNEFKVKNNYHQLNDISSVSFQKLKQSCENAKKMLSDTKKTTIIVKEFYADKSLIVPITRELFERICRDLLILCLKPIKDVLESCDFDVDEIDEIILVGGCSRMPSIRKNLKLMFNGKEPNSSINPDEVVCAGAAIHGFILENKLDPFSENIVLVDVIPLSLGVELIDGVMDVIIPRNSIIPIQKKKRYTSDTDNVTSINIKVYEGERKMTKDNLFVGDFELCDLTPTLKELQKIEVVFSIDINGIISVSATDLRNPENKKTINVNSNKGRLNKDKIEQLVKDAKNCEISDKIEREKKQMFYEIRNLCSNIQDNINNPDFKIKDLDKSIISEDIQKILDWLKETDYNRREVKDLERVVQNIKNKYNLLVLKVTGETDNVKANQVSGDNISNTSIYNDDDDDFETKYEMCQNESKELDDEEKEELKRLKQFLSELCYDIFNIISSDDINISEEDYSEIKNYIDDVLLQLYVKEKITTIEYKQKINDINNLCNDIVEKYSEQPIFKENEKTKKDELEQLCYLLLGSIEKNIINLHEKQILKIKNIVQSTLSWLIDIEVHQIEIDDSQYEMKINKINNICNTIYNTDSNVDNISIIEDPDKVIASLNLLQEQQKLQDSQVELSFNSMVTSGTSIVNLKGNN